MSGTMDTIGRGFIAGFIASLAVSWLLDPVVALTTLVWNSPSAAGWPLHFFVGTVVWGVGFALLHNYMFGPAWLRGITFALGAWLLVMLLALPLACAGLFGIRLGLSVPVLSLATHVIYGAVLGGVYGALLRRDESPPEPDAEAEKHLRPLAH